MSGGPASQEDAAVVLVHHHPGRLRLRSEAFQDDDALAARAREALAAEGAVRRVEHDAATGSLLIEYEPGRIAPDELMERAACAAGLCLAPGEPRKPDRTQGERFLHACRQLNDAAYEVTGFRVEPRMLLPIGVAVLSGVSFLLSNGPRMPRWDNLAYWSLSLFAMLHGREINNVLSSVADPKPERPRGGGAAPEPR